MTLKLKQLAKADIPIFPTLSGKAIERRRLHPEKALPETVVSLLGKVTSLRELHSSNAELPI
jgi:hypothetical protein